MGSELIAEIQLRPSHGLGIRFQKFLQPNVRHQPPLPEEVSILGPIGVESSGIATPSVVIIPHPTGVVRFPIVVVKPSEIGTPTVIGAPHRIRVIGDSPRLIGGEPPVGSEEDVQLHLTGD